MKTRLRRWALVAVLISLAGEGLVVLRTRLWGDEGMWTFDNPPLKQLKARYNFVPTKAWLNHVRLSSLRFNNGGSGSFVSPHGLVLTNHHIALGELQKLSTAQHNYVQHGFYAPTEAQELKCPGLEINQLVSMENVTAQVQGAVKPGMTDVQALKARRAEIAKIERDSLKATGLRSDVVTLYDGGEYWLYRYKKYTDIRLVFDPGQQIAFFGGDPDNFTYPRYDIDFALFRVYDHGQPVDSSHNYFTWSRRGAQPGELVFVSGNPGRTDRQDTVAQLELLRDQLLPLDLKTLTSHRDVLLKYSAAGPEQAREAREMIFFINNSIKDLTGMEQGLKNPELMALKQKQESAFRARIAANPAWQKTYGDAWDQIAQAEKKYAAHLKEFEFRSLRFASLAERAMTIVLYVEEIKKPDAERLPGFHDAQLPSLRFQLLSQAPVYPKMEEALLADTLAESLTELGPNDPYVRAALQGQSPEAAARNAIEGTKLGSVSFRKSLLSGGQAAVDASQDPLIVFVRRLVPFLRQEQKWYDDNIASVVTAAGQKLGQARFAVYGKSVYPDATFTPRLAYGTVKGYPMNGTIAPPFTTFYGLYDRAYSFGLKPPFNLPQRFLKSESRINLSTPLDFVSTCDIIGGNSGSPVINRQGKIVGLIFDGNIESLVGDFVYNGEDNRAVAVDTTAIIEALRRVYNAGPLAAELEAGSPALSGPARGRRGQK
jgi:hypothetical protein